MEGKGPHSDGAQSRTRPAGENGIATLVALMALAFLSLMGLFLAHASALWVRGSDNFESHLVALQAARSGLQHGRDLLRGLPFDELLRGPDGIADSSPAYRSAARSFRFRNPLPMTLARIMNLDAPEPSVALIADDGLISTGSLGSIPGIALIPSEGVRLLRADPGGGAAETLGRYFVKATDNNGERSELSRDPGDDPFSDGDGVVLLRAMGVIPTLTERVIDSYRKNSVALVEGRYKRWLTFQFDAAVVLQGKSIEPAASALFTGRSFLISGDASHPAVGTIDMSPSDAVDLAEQVRAQIAPEQRSLIAGSGLLPSVSDQTARVSSDPDLSEILDPAFLLRFASSDAAHFADAVLTGPARLNDPTGSILGRLDLARPWNDPAQSPLATVVEGDLEVAGSLRGGGLLIVRGSLRGIGRLDYDGLILVIGSGAVDLTQVTAQIRGALYVVELQKDASGNPSFGTARFSLNGTSDISYDSRAINLAISLIPPRQTGYRELWSGMDP